VKEGKKEWTYNCSKCSYTKKTPPQNRKEIDNSQNENDENN